MPHRLLTGELAFWAGLSSFVVSSVTHSLISQIDPSFDPAKVPAMTATDVAGAGSAVVVVAATVRTMGPLVVDAFLKFLDFLKGAIEAFTQNAAAVREDRQRARMAEQADKERAAEEAERVRRHELELAKINDRLDGHIDRQHMRSDAFNEVVTKIQLGQMRNNDAVERLCQIAGISMPRELPTITAPLIVKADPVIHVEEAGTDELAKMTGNGPVKP